MKTNRFANLIANPDQANESSTTATLEHESTSLSGLEKRLVGMDSGLANLTAQIHGLNETLGRLEPGLHFAGKFLYLGLATPAILLFTGVWGSWLMLRQARAMEVQNVYHKEKSDWEKQREADRKAERRLSGTSLVVPEVR